MALQHSERVDEGRARAEELGAGRLDERRDVRVDLRDGHGVARGPNSARVAAAAGRCGAVANRCVEARERSPERRQSATR
eukprot:5317915-Prymnesium_polylepis.1